MITRRLVGEFIPLGIIYLFVHKLLPNLNPFSFFIILDICLDDNPIACGEACLELYIQVSTADHVSIPRGYTYTRR